MRDWKEKYRQLGTGNSKSRTGERRDAVLLGKGERKHRQGLVHGTRDDHIGELVDT
jgi:hypothetical protein